MRPSIEFLNSRFKYKSAIIGAEIGVKLGEHAHNILANLPNVKLLYLIDPYLTYEGWNAPYKSEIESIKKSAQRKLSCFGDRVRWVYKKTEDAAEDIEFQLDFIYIDGNHEYSYVKKDINLAVLKVKSGGVISGHDYNGGFSGVIKAVDEFCSEYGLILHHKRENWWLVWAPKEK